MPRGWVWLQLAVAWLPLWALFAALMMLVHGMPAHAAMVSALRMIVPGALLGIIVYRFTARMHWPYPFRISFVAIHALAALTFAVAWLALISTINSVVVGKLVLEVGPGIGLFLITGVWLYMVVAGVAYGNHAAQRSAQVQSHAARTQLAALRAQLHPHFLFNALHTVVQLIPVDPRAASRAAEQLAGLLRSTFDEQRDVISLGEELTFIERYLAIESLRFGERLIVRTDIEAATRGQSIPSFALQTLVENAVRHAAAPRIEPTTLHVSARIEVDRLIVTVSDDGLGADLEHIDSEPGTGMRRLRERLQWLYGERARLTLASTSGKGFAATLSIPQSAVSNDDAAVHGRSHAA